MTRTRILVAALATLALAAPAASADPHAIDAAATAEKLAVDSAAQSELSARGRDGVQTGSLAGTTDETARALAQEQAYATYGAPAPAASAPAPVAADETARALAQEQAYATYGAPAPAASAPAPVAADDDTPWPLIGAGFAGTALLLGLAVLLVARARRPRVAT